MTSKKKLGSKLANSVRQVKLQREQAPVVPAKTGVAMKATARPALTAPTARPAAPGSAIKAESRNTEMGSKTEMLGKTELSRLHPQRVWPD